MLQSNAGTCLVVACALIALSGCEQPAQPTQNTVEVAQAMDTHPDLSGRWVVGGRRGGGNSIMVIEPNGTEVEFPTFGDYQDALAAGTVSPAARIVGRRPNYRHGNNVYAERDGGMTQRYYASPPLYKPEYWDQVRYLDVNGNVEDMTFICLPAGVPRMGPPIRIVQTESDVVLLYQHRNTWRVVPTDGRDHDPINSQDQTFLGDAVGNWDGDTLVIDTIGLNDLTWLGWPGWFHTNEMRVEERFTRTGDTLSYEVTIHDPDVLMEPWVMDPVELELDRGQGVYVEDPPCIDFDSSHMVTRERG